MMNEKCILSLLRVLTNGKVRIMAEKYDFDKLMAKAFKIAKVPLVIDKNSFNTPNQYIFFIQIEIIFDIYSDQINQITLPHNSESSIEFENIIDQEVDDYSDSNEEHKPTTNHELYQTITIWLLNTLNAILKVNNTSSFLFQFKNIEQTIEEENILKFVRFFFKDDQEICQQLNEIFGKSIKNTNKINELIKYLSLKEPKFGHFVLNCTNKELAQSTAVTFYTVFLDSFFLKKTKQELFQRCIFILYRYPDKDNYKQMLDRFCQQSKNYISKEFLLQKEKIDFFANKSKFMKKNDSKLNSNKHIEEFLSENENYQYNKVLCDFKTYLKLAFFTNNKACKGNIKYISKLNESYFAEKNIPLIIDKKNLEKYQLIENPPDAAFYQIQLIFNEFDKKEFSYHFKEICFHLLDVFKNIRIPKFHHLRDSIKTKNLSRIYQNNNVSQNMRNNFHNKEERKRILDHFFNKETDEEQKTLFNDIKPETFEQRKEHKEKESKIITKKMHQIPSNVLDSKSFWNPPESIYELKKSILCNKKQVLQNHWDNEMKSIQNFFKKPLDSQNLRLFDEISDQNFKSKLYKFYYYNEEEKSWKMNPFIIDNFFKEKFNNEKLQTNLIFFLNSNETDQISICSRLIKGLYPDLDDDSIYVYALCDKTLLYLQYEINLIIKDTNTINTQPIFLMLHIPPSKQNLPNISTIINQLYIFLSFICDIQIVILNKDSYISQIEVMNDLYRFRKCFKKLEADKSKQISIQDLNLLSFSSYDLFEDSESDDDDYEYDNQIFDDNDDDSKEDYTIKGQKKTKDDEMIYGRKYNFFFALSENLFKKEHNTIFLINDERIQNVPNDFKYNDFDYLYNYITKEIQYESYQVGHINVDNSITYNWFLNVLQSSGKKSSYSSKEVLNNLKFILMTEMSSMYINIRRNPDWKNELQKVINNRYEILKNNDCDQTTDFAILTKIFTEIASIYPLIDTEFDNECNEILKNRINDSLRQNCDTFTKELQISSANNLKFILNLIENEIYISETKKRNILNSHSNFLKKEFFSIVQYYSPINEFAAIYSKNTDIVQKQIELDAIEINKYFEEFEEKHINEFKSNNFEYNNDHVTNYVVREVEMTKEMEVFVDTNQKLEDIIEQDF